MGIRQYLRRRRMKRVHRAMDQASREGWNPLTAVRAAIQGECGFPPFDGESVNGYAARAAGVSCETVERYMERVGGGEPPLPEMASVHALMEAIGKRISGAVVT